MLDRTKIIHKVNTLASTLFKEPLSLAWFNHLQWQSLVGHPAFVQAVDAKRQAQQLAYWQGDLGLVTSISDRVDHYTLCAVDGSQIYPDKHLQGLDCFVINVAGCCLDYGIASKAHFFSEPFVYGSDYYATLGSLFSPDIVDLVREEHEFVALAGWAADMVHKAAEARLVLFDGNLLLWHLESKPTAIRDLFLNKYLSSLAELYQRRIPIAGYLSAPQFHDLANIVRAGLSSVQEILDAPQIQILHHVLTSITDIELLTNVLVPGQRTAVLQSNGSIVARYPDSLKPYFLYLHTGSEIVRLEIPGWVANDAILVNQLCALCIDQCEKGFGYPVALAEAHAHAVIKTADRDFFFQLMQRKASMTGKHVGLSQKSLKKKILGF